jgi:ATP:ADP antiporter, AAA family
MSLLKQKNFIKALFLFFNFFIIITAYYQVKPASRSLFLEFLGSDKLPYIWIGSALTLGLLMPIYHKAVKNYCRYWVVTISGAIIAITLLLFHSLLQEATMWKTIYFYIFVDIFSVVLIEQFWSLANSSYNLQQGKKWYGLIGSGGLVGGIIGGYFASVLIKKFDYQTIDLLWISSILILILLGITLYMSKRGWYQETPPAVSVNPDTNSKDKIYFHTQIRYLFLITAMILLAQMIEPIIEYQFMKIVEVAYPAREMRTAYLSSFLSILGIAALCINLLLTPLVHRFFGVIAGLSFQPFAIMISSFFYISSSSLLSAALLKISDRALSYSINRASKELLYVPIASDLIYQAKAWVDMFGYRLFKVLGSILIILLTKRFLVTTEELTWCVWFIIAMWLLCIILIQGDYKKIIGSKS